MEITFSHTRKKIKLKTFKSNYERALSGGDDRFGGTDWVDESGTAMSRAETEPERAELSEAEPQANIPYR